MKAKDLRACAKIMQEFGLSHLKMEGVELTRSVPTVSAELQKQLRAQVGHNTPLDDLSKDEDPIAHKVEQLTSLMKLSDVELVDQLFPDHIEHEEESA